MGVRTKNRSGDNVHFPIYASGKNDHWRYLLGTQGSKPLFVVGLNPHKATQTSTDKTVSKAMRIARDSGFDSFVMLNLYPVRSTNVAKLPLHPEVTAVRNNRERILKILGSKKAPHVLLAWGNDVKKRSYLEATAIHLIGNARALNPVWYRFGPTTSLQHPRHLSRAWRSWQLAAFDAQEYVTRLRA